jgi:DNA-binding transcriptional ArsR family regulator
MWQDVIVEDLRVVQDLDTLRVLADPLRLAILRVIMRDAHTRPRLMTVKEIAEELGEPQTKLYRHIKQLETIGVIRDAETRLVSGIVEHRYAPGQRELRVDDSMLGELGEDDATAALAAIFDHFRDAFARQIRAGTVRLQPPGPETPDNPGDYTASQLAALSSKFTPAAAADFHARLTALVRDFESTPRTEDGVEVNLFAAWFAPQEK